MVNETLQIAAGIGYMQEYPYERHLRDARINMIFEGTNEILRCFMALSGMSGPGKALADVGEGDAEPIKGFGLLSDFALRKARSVLGRERMSKAHPLLSREAVIFEDCTAELATHSEDMLRKHGREIAEMQYAQRRIAEMAIDLYCMAACISRTTRAIERRGEDGARRRSISRPCSPAWRRSGCGSTSPTSRRTTTSCARPSRCEPMRIAPTPSTSCNRRLPHLDRHRFTCTSHRVTHAPCAFQRSTLIRL